MSVDESTFDSLLFPILLEKLPEDIKLQVTRLISSEIWDLRELLQLLSKEIEALRSVLSQQTGISYWDSQENHLQVITLLHLS